MPSGASSTVFAGSASTGTKARKRAGRSALITSRSEPRAIDAAADELLASGHVYRDYSTEAERAAEKNAAEREKRAYRFRRKELSADGSRPVRSRGASVRPTLRGPPGTDTRPPRPDQGRRRVLRPTRSAISSSSVPTALHSTISPASSTTPPCKSPTSCGPTNTSRTRSRNSCSSRPWARVCRPSPMFRTSPSRARSRRCPSASSPNMKSSASWSIFTSISKRAICPMRCSTIFPGWAGASMARRRSSRGPS